jgi:hypothetical protein
MGSYHKIISGSHNFADDCKSYLPLHHLALYAAKCSTRAIDEGAEQGPSQYDCSCRAVWHHHDVDRTIQTQRSFGVIVRDA